MWRGYDPAYPAISNRPAYYGAQEFAAGYAAKYGAKPSSFITTRPLNLLDMRYMKVLLTQLFEHNKNTISDKDIVMATTISFGLCSLQHQIKLFKERYSAIYLTTNPQHTALKNGLSHLEQLINPNLYIEQQGVRIAETTNDAIVMGFLKELFGAYYDGYIAPNIISPFHIEKSNFILNSELVIFDPLDSGIKLLKSMPTPLTRATINYFILHSGSSHRTIDTRGMKTSYFARGGKENYHDICSDYNNEYDKGNKDIIKLYKKGSVYGKKWKDKSVSLYNSVAPGPEVDPTIFTSYNNIEL